MIEIVTAPCVGVTSLDPRFGSVVSSKMESLLSMVRNTVPEVTYPR